MCFIHRQVSQQEKGIYGLGCTNKMCLMDGEELVVGGEGRLMRSEERGESGG